MAFTSYAQNNEDVLLNRVFGGQQVGFYVDIGAYHPVDGSVTKAFYDRGWSGINIEPGSVFDVLAAARPRDVNLRMAVLDRRGEVAFFEDPADRGMSHVLDAADPIAQHTVPCDTLEAIIDRYGKARPVDFIKVDAEGAEAAIVRSTDWRRLRPRVLVFEATLPWSSVLANDEWEPGLLAAGYIRAYFDGLNCFYVPEEEWPLLSRHFAVPVNVLDGVVSQGGLVMTLTTELDRLRDAHVHATQCAVTFRTERDGVQALLGPLRDEVARLVGELDSVTNDRADIVAKLAKAQADHAETIAQRDGLYAEVLRREAASVAAEAPPAAPTPLRRMSWLRRAARRGYDVFRPVVRPIAWRARGFLLGPTMTEIGAMQAQLRWLESATGSVLSAAQSTMAPGDLQALLAQPRTVNGAPPHIAGRSELQSLAKAMEEALLTIAMATERRPAGSATTQPTPMATSSSVPLRLPGGRHADIAVGAADLSVGAALLAADGDWEPHVRHYLEATVKPDWSCVDIGANLGAHTLSLASLATAGQVVAFEADPANFALLTRNADALPPPRGRITPVQIALWDSPGVLTIGGADELAGCSFVSAGTTDLTRTEDRLRTVVDAGAIAGTALNLRLSQVPAMRLDDWVAEQGLTRLDIIKLDVEGAEANVIRGAQDTIRRLRPILLVEYNPPCAAAYFDQPAAALYDELAKRFASIHVLEADGRLSLLAGWDALAARLATGKGYEDLICLPGAVR